ncbi:MAG TPA: hypothetical protein VK892_21945 [Pyrinomonadaceae bacterium]|nr:hypothetical protein [Pyrinomonadaceae bacterium]
MKICPECRSVYTDETLNFCLTDGTLLVAEEALPEYLSSEETLHTAKTLRDSQFINRQTPHQTSDSSAPTLPMIPVNTDDFAARKNGFSRSPLYFIIGAILIIGTIGSIWWIFKDEDAPAVKTQTQTENRTPESRRPVASLTAEQENQVKKEVSETLERWRSSIVKRDIETHMKSYAATLENYYKESGIDRNHVRADRQRAFDRYESLDLQVDKLTITPESENAAVAVFDKSWTFKNPQKTSTGSVQQEMRLVKENGSWIIVGEKDEKVYFLNNRENPEANTAGNQ